MSLELPEHRAAIQEIALRPEVKLIVVDSLRGSHELDENSSNTMSIVKWLAELARNNGKPVLLSHHLRKQTLLDSNEVTLDEFVVHQQLFSPHVLSWHSTDQTQKLKEAKRLLVISRIWPGFRSPLGFRSMSKAFTSVKPPNPRTTILKPIKRSIYCCLCLQMNRCPPMTSSRLLRLMVYLGGR